jgi:surface protein
VDTTEGNGNASLQIPTSSDYVYDYTVNWTSVSDPSATGTVSGLTGNTTIGFPSGGQYDIRITGLFPAIRFGDKFSDAAKLIRIEQWGNGAWASMQRAFANCNNLSSYPPKDIPNLSGVNSMGQMFAGASLSFSNLGGWDVSNVTSMESMFQSATTFNADISLWDVSNVTDMSQMFSNAISFNQNIGGWGVSGVTDMSSMFENASAFNQDIGDWDVSEVIDMRSMFNTASLFNADISLWNVSSVTDMNAMFANTPAFNRDISGWNVSAVTNMGYMFRGATSFNRDLSGWCVSGISPQPFNFDLGATAWALPRPNWGSPCPP